MRNIAMFLLFLNVGYFGWGLLVPDLEPFPPDRAAFRNAGNRLILLSESGSQNVTPRSGIELNSMDAARCLVIGDFVDVTDASAFRDRLESEGVQSTVWVDSEYSDHSFHVYLPPFSSNSIAYLTLESITEALGSSNSSVIGSVLSREGFENGISFGTFETIEAANAVLAVLKGIGYEAEIDQISELTEAFQVLVKNEILEFESVILPKILLERPALNQTEKLCETIAQGTQFP